MNKTEYLAELSHRLRRLPKEEFDSALMYYEEYFDDAGVENEQKVIESLGSPAALAGQLIGEFAIKSSTDGTTPTTKKSVSKIWIGILAMFASPIALPISAALAIVVFALVICLYAILLALGISGFAMILSGIVIGIAGISQIPFIAYAGLSFLGGGLIVLAFGIVFSLLTVILFRLSFNGIAKLVGKVLIKRGNKKAAKQNREESNQYE